MSHQIIIASHFLRPKVLMRIGFCVADSSRGNDDADVDNIWLAGWLAERARAGERDDVVQSRS